MGQSATAGFDIWTSFTSKSLRNQPFEAEFKISDYRIDATLDADLKLHCITHMKLRLGPQTNGTLPFEIARQMQITGAFINGQPAELLTLQEPRGSIESIGGNTLFALVSEKPLETGKIYEVEVRHEGSVITDAGNHVYFVGSRGTWYPAEARNLRGSILRSATRKNSTWWQAANRWTNELKAVSE